MQIEIQNASGMMFNLTSKSETVIKEWLKEMSEMIISEDTRNTCYIRIFPTNDKEHRLVKDGRAFNSSLDAKALRVIGDLFHAMAYDYQEMVKKREKK